MSFLLPYYRLIYWIIVFLMTTYGFGVINRNAGYSVIKRKDNYGPILLFLVFYILLYGLRPTEGPGVGRYFVDTVNYVNAFKSFQEFGNFSSFGADEAAKDPLFAYFMYFCAQFLDVHFFLVICMFLYLVPMYSGCRKMDSLHGATLMIFCIGAFSFYTFSVNGIRNGVACSLIILALGLLCRERKLWALLLSLIAVGFHKATAIPILCMFFVYFVRKPKILFFFWGAAIVVSLAIGNFIEEMLLVFGIDERLTMTLSGDEIEGIEFERKFRWDFLLYSSMPILIGWYTIFKRKIYNRTYLLLLGTYICANSFWVLLIRAMFTNRIAYLSWFIYPIVLAYPLLNFPVFKKNHSKKTAWILLAHFGLTTVLMLLGK